MRLTVKAVDAAKPREKAYKLADGHGLYLYVPAKGAKSWRANYTEAGKQKTRTYDGGNRTALVAPRRLEAVSSG